MRPDFRLQSCLLEDGSIRSRVTLTVLYEDEFHDTFIRAFLDRLRLSSIGRLRPLPKENKAEVFRAFAEEIRALRNAHVQTRLIVVVDADELSAEQIEGRLRHKLRKADLPNDLRNDPVLVIHPRWEMENWALHLLGESIGEERDRNARSKVRDRGREAGRLLADSCKSGHLPQPTLPSLEAACREWNAYRERHGL